MSAGGIVDVEVRVVDGEQAQSKSLLITVSNSRAGSSRLGNVDRLFVPFGATVQSPRKQDSVWTGGKIAPDPSSAVACLWRQNKPTVSSLLHRIQEASAPLDNGGHIVGSITANIQHPGSRVTTSTGLGLPLCRFLAVASGGWAGLEDSDSSPSHAAHLPPPITGFTQFWCAIATTVTAHNHDVNPNDAVLVHVTPAASPLNALVTADIVTRLEASQSTSASARIPFAMLSENSSKYDAFIVLGTTHSISVEHRITS